VIGSAIGAGVIGLVVGAAIADRAYGPEPFVVELTPGSGGTRGLTARRGRGRREERQDFARWCFSARETAESFVAQFGGVQAEAMGKSVWP